MTTLLLTRHGETVDNANKIMQGQTQGELNATGVAEAEQLAQKMKDEKIDAFVSSDLKRSIDTCRILAKPHGQGVKTTALLRERDWGRWTGKYIPSLQYLNEWPGDVESLAHLKARAQQFLDWIVAHYAGKTVMAVGHGIVNKAIQSVYYKKPMNEIAKMDNCEVRKLILE